MIKKTITYPGYDGKERTEDFYFNLNQAEATMLNMSVDGGLIEMMDRIVKADNTPAIAKVFKDVLLASYGEKSPDGKRFIKSEELSTAFSQTEAYSMLFMELATNTEAATEFFNGVVSGIKPSESK